MPPYLTEGEVEEHPFFCDQNLFVTRALRSCDRAQEDWSVPKGKQAPLSTQSTVAFSSLGAQPAGQTQTQTTGSLPALQ